MELKEALFLACWLEWNKFTKGTCSIEEQHDAYTACTALYSVIEQAGLAEEYEMWKEEHP